jgi:hypothetical protein
LGVGRAFEFGKQPTPSPGQSLPKRRRFDPEDYRGLRGLHAFHAHQKQELAIIHGQTRERALHVAEGKATHEVRDWTRQALEWGFIAE